MNLGEYIDTYRRGRAALTLAEAKVIGLPYPLVSGWFKQNRLMEVDSLAMRTARAQRMDVVASRANRPIIGGTTKKERKQAKAVRKAEKLLASLVKPKLSAVGVGVTIEVVAAPYTDAEFAYANAPAFLASFEWRQLRLKALQKYGRRCLCCGATPATGAVMHVDHVRPRRKFPQLALDINNLQVLCEDCNHGKGNKVIDFRQQ